MSGGHCSRLLFRGCLLLYLLASWSGNGLGASTPLIEVPYEQFIVVPAAEGRVRVLQVTTLYNAGVHEAANVIVPIPEGARLMDPPDGWGTVEPGAGGLVDRRPLVAGELREYRILYELMMGSRPLALRRALPYPVREIGFWVEARELRLVGLRLEGLGEEIVGGEPFRVHRMVSVAPHEAWQVVLRPAGRASRPDLADLSRHGDPLAGLSEGIGRLGWAAPVLAAGLGGVFLWRRRRYGDGSVDDERDRREEALREEIVHLDVAYRAGDLDEDVYRARRRELINRLLAYREDKSIE